MVIKFYDNLTSCSSGRKPQRSVVWLLQARKPDSVLGYHLSGIVITGYLHLPTLKLERAALKRFYTWHFSPQGLPEITISCNSRELLPHVFTLAPPRRGGNFLWHCLVPPSAGVPPLAGCGALCCPDFPTLFS